MRGHNFSLTKNFVDSDHSNRSKRVYLSSKHEAIGRINISLQAYTTVTMICYYDSPSPDQFRYETDLSN